MTYPERFDAPEADAAEQATDALPGDDAVDETGPAVDDIEAPDWDAREQHLAVELEDDGYR